jgi:hypothetical protein
MSTLDLITRWEDALAQALSPTERGELPAGDIEVAAGVVIRSSLKAGSAPSLWELCHTDEFTTCGLGCGPP